MSGAVATLREPRTIRERAESEVFVHEGITVLKSFDMHDPSFSG